MVVISVFVVLGWIGGEEPPRMAIFPKKSGKIDYMEIDTRDQKVAIPYNHDNIHKIGPDREIMSIDYFSIRFFRIISFFYEDIC